MQTYLLLFVAMAAIFYLLILRPQQRAKKAKADMAPALEVGAEILTVGGFYGTSVALLERVAFDRRRVTSDSWETYPILRFSDVPKVAVELIDRPELPFLGAGEASMAPTIAAIGAAITDALGIRPRALPFTPEQLASAT